MSEPTASDMNPTHPGVALLTDYMKPAGITVAQLARAIDLEYKYVRELTRGKREMSAAVALRVARFFGTSPDLWINLQKALDLHRALERDADVLATIQPLQVDA